MARAMRARRGTSRRPEVEALEGRALLNASIDIGTDGALVYRLGADVGENVQVRRLGDAYTLQSSTTIDVTSNGAGLAVSGSGTFVVTVSGPSSLRIVTGSQEQGVVVRGTGVATAIDLQASRSAVFLGDDGAEGAGGLAALGGPISIVAADGTEGNRLTVADGDFDHDPSGVLTYALSATAVTAEGIDGFAGITYSGMAALLLQGTQSRSAPSALYLVTGTADGTATTIDATGGFGRDFSIVGMSSDPASRLTLLSAGEANLRASYIGSPTVFAGGSRSSIWIEQVRDATHGLNSSLVIDAAAGGVDLNVGPYSGAVGVGASMFWILKSGTEGPSPFVRLQDDRGPGEAGLFFRADQVENLGIDARGGEGRGSLLVDFAGGDPIPAAAPAWGQGLIYVGGDRPDPLLRHALGFIAGLPGESFAEQLHVAMPLYRGAVELTRADGSKRYVSYQLSEGSPRFDDSLRADSYLWVDRYDGVDPSVRADSDLKVTPDRSWAWSTGTRNAMKVSESKPGLLMAELLLAEKVDVKILRGLVPGETTTTLGRTAFFQQPDRLERLSIENASPGATAPQLVRLHAAPEGVETSVIQGSSDEAVVVLGGVGAAASVALRGGGPGRLYVDASGLPLSDGDFLTRGAGWRRLVQPGGATPVDYRGFAGLEVYNAAVTPAVAVDGLAFPTDAGQAHVDVAAAVLSIDRPGASTVELSATIEWGDGHSEYATFRPIPDAQGRFQIVGSHTYATAGVVAPSVWVAGQVVASYPIDGQPVTFHTPIVPIQAERPIVTVSIPYPRYGVFPPWEAYPYTNQARPTLEGFSQLGPGSRVDVYAVPLGAGAASSSVIALGTVTIGVDPRWSLVSDVTLADGVYDLYAVSSSEGWARGVGRGRTGGITINTQGPQITAVSVDPRAGMVSFRVRAWVLDTWSLPWDWLVAADGRAVTASDLGQVDHEAGPPREYTIWVKTDGPIAPGEYILTMQAAEFGLRGGILDFSGNKLDGAFDGTFPTGGSNTGQDFRARLVIHRDGGVQVLPV